MSTKAPSTAAVRLYWLLSLLAIVAVIWIVVLRRIEFVHANGDDTVSAVAYVILGGWLLLQANKIARETQKVREGWIGRTSVVRITNFNGTHAEFARRFRRGLTVRGWLSVVIGAAWAGLLATIILVPGIRRDPMQYPLSAWTGVLFGLALLTAGVAYLRGRRILDSPRQASAPPSN